MKSSFYLSFGVWITILPFLGIPGSWRYTLIAISGIFLILTVVGPEVLKRLQPTKTKIKKKQDKEETLSLKNIEAIVPKTEVPSKEIISKPLTPKKEMRFKKIDSFQRSNLVSKDGQA